jgi:hypothetical protein
MPKKPHDPFFIDARTEQLIETGIRIREQEASASDHAFLTRYLVQATLPHRQPKGAPPIWHRTNGDYVLSIRPGWTVHPKSKVPQPLGYPAGSLPRLLMYWLTTEAIRTGSRRLVLGNTLADFMKALGLNHRNGGPGSVRSDRARLRLQMERLFRATISFEYTNVEVSRWLDMQVAPKGEMWWNLAAPADQPTLWESWIELGEAFYEAIISSPVPVDMRALRALRQSPLALDLYAWSTYKTYCVSQAGRPQRLSWRQLHQQLGADYADPRDFKKRAKAALRRIAVVYPGLRLEEVTGGLLVRPGRTAISSKS